MIVNDPKLLQVYRRNGIKIAKIRDTLAEFAQTHHRMEDIEAHAVALIKQAGGESAFMRVPGYKWATCISVNDAIVHGIPQGTIKPGDIVTIDTGMYLQGTTTDTATTIVIGQPSLSQTHFLKAGRKALEKAILQVKTGAKIKHLSRAMQRVIEAAGYTVSRTLTGHGLGATIHEEPSIPCFTSPDPRQQTTLQTGMVLAIEVMYMKGSWQLRTAADGWTIYTQDGSAAAVFEEDVIVTPQGPEVITRRSLLEPDNKVW